MKQNLNVGNMVDDGTGDYLREGGLKLNNNFDDLYFELGDGTNPHPAGAWKTTKSNVVNATFGKSYALDTSSNAIQVKLPKGTTADYNKVIRIRDVFGTWQTNAVTLTPGSGDTLKGDAGSKVFQVNLTDLELVYCAPGRWEYIANKQLNKISNGDVATVIRKEYIATAGQTDFLDIFGGNMFNTSNTQVYRRGNLLFYGDTFTDNSDYGSVGPGATITELDGVNIRLRTPCEEGDALIVITYLDGIAQWRSTYNRLSATLLDIKQTNGVTNPGSQIVADLSTLKEIKVADLGYALTSNTGLINPNTFEVYVNGVILNEAGRAGLPVFRCEGASALNKDDCELQNGVWVESHTDYTFEQDDAGGIETIKFDRTFEHGDVLMIKWYNNDIGTTMTIDEILDVTDPRYINRGPQIELTGTVRVTDYNKPQWPNVEANGNTVVDVSSPSNIFDLIYPVGTIYENAINPNNPVTYMGFGSWKLWGEKQVTVGWTQDTQDTLFGLNNNDIDSNGNPSHTAGGTGGNRNVTLTNDNLPRTQTDEKVLVVDANGPIIVGGCQFDPDENGPAYDKYREANAVTNATHTPPTEISVVQPYITVYRWMRIS